MTVEWQECFRSNTLNTQTPFRFLIPFADAPLCVTDKVVIVGAFRNENLNIYCEVQADPPPRYVHIAVAHLRYRYTYIYTI